MEIDAEISGIQVAAASSSRRTQNNFLSSSLLSDSSCKYCFMGGKKKRKSITGNIFSSFTAVSLERVRVLTKSARTF